MVRFAVEHSSSLLCFEESSKCYKHWDQMHWERPVVPLHWCCYSWSLFLVLLWCFGWSGLQTMPLETVVLVDCDSSCCCFSPGAVWGFHIRLDAWLVPSTLHCSCSVGKARCVYRNNPRALWTDWKQAPVHSIGTGPDAEDIQSSAGDNNHEEAQLNYLINIKYQSFASGGQNVFINTWWASMWFFSIFKPHLHVI